MSIDFKRIGRRLLDVFAVVLVIVLIAGAGLWYQSYSTAQTEREEQAASQKAKQTRLTAFNKLMESRTALLVLSSQVDGTLAQVKAKIAANEAEQKSWDEEWADRQSAYTAQFESVKAHNAEEDAKFKTDPRYTTRDYWSYPNYPSPPEPITVEFGTEINVLIAEAAALQEYITELKKTSGSYKDKEINPMYEDLLAIAEETKSEAERDIEILGGIAIPGAQGTVINAAKADLIKYDAGNEPLRALTKKALAFIDEAGLDTDDYEVPGGADTNPADKSNLQ